MFVGASQGNIFVVALIVRGATSIQRKTLYSERVALGRTVYVELAREVLKTRLP